MKHKNGFATGAIVLMVTTAAMAEPTEPHLAKARMAVAGLGEGLKKELMASLKADGPVVAVQVCKIVAPALAAQATQGSGLAVGRTALKVRNPKNAPDAFERRVLEDFVAKIAAGADPAKLEHYEAVTEDGERLFRYMKAIPMAAEPCGVCHGGALAADLKTEIEKLYPQDQATGFKPGELRGAFTVTEKLD